MQNGQETINSSTGIFFYVYAGTVDAKERPTYSEQNDALLTSVAATETQKVCGA